MSNETRRCRKCGEELPIERFPVCKKRDKPPYHSWRCYDCRANYVSKMTEAKRNGRISRLLRWAPTRIPT